MPSKYKILLSELQLNLVIERLCHQLIEHHAPFENCCIIGIQHKGALLAERICSKLEQLQAEYKLPLGKMDITFSRDDFKTSKKLPSAHPTQINFLIENKKVILVDDVLYTGRTIQAALMELQNYGRPEKVELLVLIDRRFNRQLPIQADYYGSRIDAVNQSYVKVDLKEEGGDDQVLFFDVAKTKEPNVRA
ncbi:MAG: bifunctional pyr operon transcriptional regulator/uracil phosphoribosyltransferase PyrR [Saprospiraceae bacterium]|nr:bifunctional pyr operon transcriptional regulator/uracil phosphoribosyltransferase PyrR [Saprospiraceae bacterium]